MATAAKTQGCVFSLSIEQALLRLFDSGLYGPDLLDPDLFDFEQSKSLHEKRAYW